MESLTELVLLKARPLQSARYSSKTAQTAPRRHFLQPKCASLSAFSASAEANGPARDFRTGPFLLLCGGERYVALTLIGELACAILQKAPHNLKRDLQSYPCM